ncbi:protein RISC-INTERACTING CLEARING 3'-5' EXORIBONUCLEASE 1-like [Trifolium pratense]|uniref:protein RISC-INTERACTING CLEARING 3'-5' EXORIBONUCLEASE 1-like n=1 Tax=Trifolium pratense TaxID=57577 RepID=UPI001E69338F|nr:protein RISC-INTERACTING CLEARING 3'-5' EXORIBONUCLEASE 1-like [Trifolium pratense]
MVQPPEVYEETFELNGVQIKTTVISDVKEIEKHISSFLCPPINHQTKVIGFDAEWYLLRSPTHLKLVTYAYSRCATIQLCDGHSCLIIQLNWLCGGSAYWENYIPFKALVNFLRLPNITFVGVGIKENLAMLEKQYGIVCRNAVELGPLAATAMRMPRLSYCGVDELAFVVNGFHLGEHRPLTTAYDWSCKPLGKDLVKLATVNVYSYFKIGSTLLQSNVVGGLDSGLVRLW